MAENKHLTFLLKSEFYGIPILKVKEIIGLMDITHIPRMPDFVKGVINLRGNIIPVVDLRIKFGLLQQEYKERTCIIVIEINTNGVMKQNGLVVDAVSDVIAIDDASAEPPLSFGNSAGSNILTGIGKVKDKVVMLLNVDKIFTEEEVDTIANIS